MRPKQAVVRMLDVMRRKQQAMGVSPRPDDDPVAASRADSDSSSGQALELCAVNCACASPVQIGNNSFAIRAGRQVCMMFVVTLNWFD